MGGEELGQLDGQAEGPPAGLRLWRSEHDAAVGDPGGLLDDGEATVRQVDAPHAKPGALAPAQAQHGTEPDHGGVVGPGGMGQGGQVVGGQLRSP
ncbi:MAG TPA: hypothetical protein VFP61_00485 [Acidimicrobiales bacterium]|nr:hypothetical protein [Acidimicrobiales bacterium]